MLMESKLWRPYGKDFRNLALLVAGFLLVAAIISPARSYPVFDDWAYAQATKSLANGQFVHHEWIVATDVVPQALGALSVRLFGFSFTSLTLVGLGFGLLGVVAMYLLLKQVGVSPGASALGAATLALNPHYVFLSYSFMTDVPFVALVIVASLLLARGMQGYGEVWLWLGSAATVLAYLTRQHGILLAVAALGYLWWSRRWTWRRALSVALLPAVALAVYTLWEAAQPMRLELYLEAQMRAGIPMLSAQWFGSRLQMMTWVLEVTGLFLAPILRLPRRLWIALPIWTTLLVIQVRSMLAGVSLFPENGSVIDHTGFAMFGYNSTPVLSEWVWTALGMLGSLLISLQVAHFIERTVDWFRRKPWRKRSESDPVLMIYASGLLMAAAIFSLTPFVYDRYILPVLPALIVASLRRPVDVGAEGTVVERSKYITVAARWGSVAVLAAFSLGALHDYKEHAEARWAAGEELLSQGVSARQVFAGFEWENWYLYEEGTRLVRESGNYASAGSPASLLLDPVYVVSDREVDRYEPISIRAYTSWLSGGEVRKVLVLKRTSTP